MISSARSNAQESGEPEAGLLGRFCLPRQIHDLAARGVALSHNKVDGGEHVCEVRAREGHRLHGAEVEGAIRLHEVKGRLSKESRLLDAG